MYIDLIVLVVGLILVIMFFRRFSSFVFFMAIVEIFLRILTFIKKNISLKDVSNIIDKYIPESIFSIIDNYTSQIPTLCIILKWCFVVIMAIFLGYIVKIFISKKKI